MLTSSDGGKTFTEEFTPRGLMIDFEVDPANPERIVASTDTELFRTEDGGKSWRPLTGRTASGSRGRSRSRSTAPTRTARSGVSGNGGTRLAGRRARRRRAVRAARHRSEGAVPRVKRWIDPRDDRRRRHVARSLPALIGAAGVAALCPAAADAHSLVRTGGNELAYLSSDAVSLNTLVVKRSGANIDFRDPTVDGGLDSGPCAPGDITDDANSWVIQALCPAAGASRLRIDLGDREDSAVVQLDLPVTLLGGTGADKLTTAGGADAVAGDDGDDVIRPAPATTRSTPATATTTSTAARATTSSRRASASTRSPAPTATTTCACATGSPTPSAAAPARTRSTPTRSTTSRSTARTSRGCRRRSRRAAAPPAATAPRRRSASAARPSSAPAAAASRSSRPRASAARSPPRASSTSPDSRCRSARTASASASAAAASS